MVASGLKAIYLSGWQVAADANTAGQTYPDQSLYPADSVPKVVAKINNAFQRQDQVGPWKFSKPGFDNTAHFMVTALSITWAESASDPVRAPTCPCILSHVFGDETMLMCWCKQNFSNTCISLHEVSDCHHSLQHSSTRQLQRCSAPGIRPETRKASVLLLIGCWPGQTVCSCSIGLHTMLQRPIVN